MSDTSKGRTIHGLAAQAREDGNQILSLSLSDWATIVYQEEEDFLGMAEVIADRFLVFRHLYEKTGDKRFLILAKHDSMASVELAKESGDPKALAIPLYNLAKAQETLGELSEAVKTYEEALENMTNNPPELHNRPGVLADVKIHLYTCEYANGDKSALDKVYPAISELESSDEEKYNKDVWLSGAHMRLAQILKDDNPEKAREHLQKAKEIIDSNPDLKIRLEQWQKLEQRFK